MEGDRLEDADVALQRERVLPDEEVLVPSEAVHRVSRADADESFVRLDEDESRLE